MAFTRRTRVHGTYRLPAGSRPKSPRYGGCGPPAAEPSAAGVERYLEDLWRDAPWPVALGNALTALAMCAVPLAPGAHCGRFPRSRAMSRARSSRACCGIPGILVRLLGFTVRGRALVAPLRDPATRAAILGGGDRPPRRSIPVPTCSGSATSSAPAGWAAIRACASSRPIFGCTAPGASTSSTSTPAPSRRTSASTRSWRS